MNFAELLIKEEVLKFGDFTLKSGRLAPYFLNFGNIKRGSSIADLSDFYSEIFIKNIDPKDRILFGPSYKGIPLATAVSISLSKKGIDLPFSYNRKEKKDHGEGGNIIGEVPRVGKKITIIEDVITRGTAIRETIDILKPTGSIIDSCIIAVDRMEKGKGDISAIREIEEEFNIKIYAISNIRALIEELGSKVESVYVKKIEDYLELYGC